MKAERESGWTKRTRVAMETGGLERHFLEPRSTFDHLRSITSPEVIAGFSCRGHRSGLSSLSPFSLLRSSLFKNFSDSSLCHLSLSLRILVPHRSFSLQAMSPVLFKFTPVLMKPSLNFVSS